MDCSYFISPRILEFVESKVLLLDVDLSAQGAQPRATHA